MKRQVSVLAIGLIALLGAACNDAEHTGQTVQAPRQDTAQQTFDADASPQGQDKLELNNDADTGGSDFDDQQDFAADRDSCKAQGGNWSIINAECHICGEGEVFDGVQCSLRSQVDVGNNPGLDAANEEMKKKAFEAFGNMLNQLQQNLQNNPPGGGGGGGGC